MTISEGLLREFVEGLKQSASAQERAASTSEAIALALRESTGASEKRQEQIMSSLAEMHSARGAAVQDIKDYISEDVGGREQWWRNSFKLWAAAMVIATLLGVPVGRILAKLLHITP